ncbi:MAG: heavy-metal-associated domain-containing protein [Desulfosporosinus sp.]
MSQTILKVEGMTCTHCKMRVEKALQVVSGVKSVKVDLADKEAVVKGDAERTQLIKAIEDAGYTVVEESLL